MNQRIITAADFTADRPWGALNIAAFAGSTY